MDLKNCTVIETRGDNNNEMCNFHGFFPLIVDIKEVSYDT